MTFAKAKDPVVTDTVIRLIPDHDFPTCPPLDILLVGGGGNPLPQMQDDDVISFLRDTGNGAEYITSMCTGALILAEAPNVPPPELVAAMRQAPGLPEFIAAKGS